MGNSSSLPLHAQPQFPRVVNQRFVDHNRMVSLTLDTQFFALSDSSGSPLSEIRDADLDTVVFKVQRPSPNQKKIMLMDKNGITAVALERFPVESGLAIYEATNPLGSVARHTQAPTPLLVRMETNFRPMEKRLTVDLEGPQGEITRVRCHGSWESHDAWLYIERATVQGRNSEMECIVRVKPIKVTGTQGKSTKTKGVRSSQYQVTIAPGVDVAFVVLACAALDQEAAMKGETFHPTEEDIARLKKRPVHSDVGGLNSRRSAAIPKLEGSCLVAVTFPFGT